MSSSDNSAIHVSDYVGPRTPYLYDWPPRRPQTANAITASDCRLWVGILSVAAQTKLETPESIVDFKPLPLTTTYYGV